MATPTTPSTGMESVDAGFDRTVHWAAHYLLLRELVSHMTSLYRVMQQAHSNNSSCSYLVAVPPDDAIPSWALSESGRVSQGFVRSHLFRQRDNVLTGLTENVSAVMKLKREQPFFSQCPGSDSEEEALHLFNACTAHALQDELTAQSANHALQAYVFGSVAEMDQLKSAPTQGTLTITTPWSTTAKVVTIYAVDQVRNCRPTVASNRQPFLTLVFIDASLYCEFDWQAIEMENDAVKPGGEMTSGQHAAAASLRANIGGGSAAAGGAAAGASSQPQIGGADDGAANPQQQEEALPPHSWLSRLYNQIAFATPKPTGGATGPGGTALVGSPAAQQQQRGGAASESASAAGDGSEAVPRLVLEPSIMMSQSVVTNSEDPFRRPTHRSGRRSSLSSSRRLSRTTSARSVAAYGMNDPSKSRIFEVAPMFRALLTIVNEAVCDAVLLRLDTELVIFDSTYVCIPGFEQFTVSKVNQIVEALTEDFVNGIAKAGRERKAAIERAKEAERAARTKRRQLAQMQAAQSSSGGATSAQQQQQQQLAREVAALTKQEVEETPLRAAPCPIELSAAEKASLLDGANDTDVDIIVTALHTIFTAGVVPVVLTHWRTIHHDADLAFQRQCFRLRRSKPSDFGVDLADLPLVALEPAVMLVGEFDNSYSVFTFMRIAERIFAVIVEAMDLWDVAMTADISIPLLVYLLSQGQPQTMMSTISFVTSFSLQALDMSALGYSFTTIEAAAHQLVQEYNARVAERGEKDSSDEKEDDDELEDGELSRPTTRRSSRASR